MISRRAAEFIVKGSAGVYSDETSRIRITPSDVGPKVVADFQGSLVSGILLDAWVDELGDLSMIFPETSVSIIIEREAFA